MSATPKVSPALQALIDKGLLDRLPVSFSSFCLDQMKDWDLLFPAERSYHERLFGLLDRSSPEAVDRLCCLARSHRDLVRCGPGRRFWCCRHLVRCWRLGF